MERVTATLEADTLAAIRSVAGHRGLSRFLQVAAEERLTRLRLLAVVDELDRRHGAPDDAVHAAVAAEAARIFGGTPKKQARPKARTKARR